MHFANQLPNLQSGDSGLNLNICQRVITERYKESVIHATSSEISRQRAECVCAVVNIKWLDLNKRDCLL